MKFILLQLLLAGRKMMQNEKTEQKQGQALLLVNRRRTNAACNATLRGEVFS